MEKANLFRLKQCMERTEQGERLTIGFLGGSITQGSLATTEENTYAYQVYSWWVNTFPNAEIHYVNGGIGGTTSHYGVARAVTDVLMYQPDVVVVDFSVNDDANEFFMETYEGVVRKLLLWNSKPAVILLNNVFYDTGENAQQVHNQVGDWYGLPHVSIKDTVYEQIKKGIYTREELTPDGLHPNDKGHKLVAGEIIKFLEQVKGDMEHKELEEQVKEPMTKNSYEHAKRLTIREISPKCNGFYADTNEKMGHLDHFKNGWIGKKAGDKIVFEIEAENIAIQYRKTIQRPACIAKVILDKDEKNAIVLDSNFEEDWGDCLYLQPILHHGERKIHTIEIKLLSESSEEKTPFYLMSFIVA